jgi:D-serine deaminase-like pyridoxal phosphate-dependent protein
MHWSGATKAKLRADIPTPALLLDLDAFEDNINKMAAHLKARNKAFRPHGKTHKCPEVAKALLRAGAIGCCAARLSEAEVFAEFGIPGLLVTTAVIGRDKIARAVALANKAPDTIFVVDNEQNVRDINDAAGTRNEPIKLAVDLFFGRTGITPGQPAVELAQLIDKLPNVTFVGLQSYDGAAAHTTPFDTRRARTTTTMGKAVETKAMLERAGIRCPLVTGGSTGTYRFDSENPGITELQPGSFVFMDMEYGTIGGPAGSDYRDFQEFADGGDDGRVEAGRDGDRRRRLQGLLDRSSVHAPTGRYRRRDVRLGRRRAWPARRDQRLARSEGRRPG